MLNEDIELDYDPDKEEYIPLPYGIYNQSHQVNHAPIINKRLSSVCEIPNSQNYSSWKGMGQESFAIE